MKTLFKSIPVIIAACYFSACQKEFSIEGNPQSLYDSSATAFLNAAGITDPTQMSAINNLVTQLKEDSLWDKFLAIYPMIGGTSKTTMYNLKDPRDADGAYRITWHGTPAINDSGVTCTDKTQWGDSHFSDNGFQYNNSAISFYSGTENTVGGYDMGCSNHTWPYNMLSIYQDYDNDVANTWFGKYNDSQKNPASTKGLFMNASLNDAVVFYQNGVAASTFGIADDSYTNLPITIGQVTDDDMIGGRKCQLATIGLGLTAAQAADFYKIAKAFQTTLNR